jgi:hypothetical protein
MCPHSYSESYPGSTDNYCIPSSLGASNFSTSDCKSLSERKTNRELLILHRNPDVKAVGGGGWARGRAGEIMKNDKKYIILE